MSKKDRRAILESLASRIDPTEHKQHLEEQLTNLKNQASRVMVAVQQIEDDPHAQEVEKSQVDSGYQQLESLLWRIQDIEERLDDMGDAHVESITGLNRAQRRNAAKQAKKVLKRNVSDDLRREEDSTGDDGNDPPVAEKD